MLNIYLDIDGVLRGTASPLADRIEFLEYILLNYPNTTYWLTTHCRSSKYDHCEAALKTEFPDELAELACRIIKSTDWNAMKTEVIDMDQDFIWFDDNLFGNEKRVLEERGVDKNFVWMNPRDPEMAKKALEKLKNLPK